MNDVPLFGTTPNSYMCTNGSHTNPKRVTTTFVPDTRTSISIASISQKTLLHF